MAENKTKQTNASVSEYLANIADDERRKDCKALAAVMKRATGETPKMWGASIVGYGRYHYKYDSGHEGDSCLVGFSSRKGDISVYVMGTNESPEAQAMLAKLGKHKMAKACLYIKRMSDVDTAVLEKLVKWSYTQTKKRYAKA
jgi:Domain of unknown function (DU1801)